MNFLSDDGIIQFDVPLIYESWDLKPTALPERSHLYPLEPVGMGTPYVESLTGYVTRLAESHGVLPGILITRELAPLINKLYFQNGASRGLGEVFNRAQALNGTGDMALDFIQALQRLTKRDDLHFLTMRFWAEIIPTRSLFRAKKAWCPICYLEWLQKSAIYEPLLWTINSITVCPQHQKPLCYSCPNCRHELPLLTWHSRPGYCSNCHSWLGINQNIQISTHALESQTITLDQLHWQSWVADVVGELILSAQRLESPPPKESIAKSLSLIIDTVTQGNAAAFARRVGIPKNTLWMWQSAQTLPQLDILLNICSLLEISLLDFLTPESLSDKSFSKISHNYITANRTPRVSPKSFNPNQVQLAMHAILASEREPPLTMNEVANQLGFDRRTIYRNFPDLCRAISAKYRSYTKACHLKKIEHSCKEVQQIVLSLHNHGVYPTEARVSELMTHPGYFRYKQVRAVLHQARRQLGV